MKLSSIFFSFLIILFVPVHFSAQIFGLNQKNPQEDYLDLLSYPNDGKYRVVCGKRDALNWKHIRSKILIFNNDLTYSDSINFLNGITIPQISTPLKVGGRFLWPSVFQDTIISSAGNTYLSVLETDLNYTFVKLHKISKISQNAVSLTTSGILKLNSRFYIAKLEDLNTSVSSTLFKLDSSLVKLDSSSYATYITRISNKNGKIVLSGTGLPLPCFNKFGGRLEMLTIDTNFVIANCHVHDSLGNINFGTATYYSNNNVFVDDYSYRVIPFSSTKYFVSGNARMGTPLPLSTKNVMVRGILDYNDQTLHLDVIKDVGSHYCFVDWQENSVISADKKYIISVGVKSPEMSNTILPFFHKTKIIVSKMDTLGNVSWTKEHCGDMYYDARSIAFTSDGGCIVAGMRYDSANTAISGIMQGFLLKLDINGNYNGLGTFSNTQSKSVKSICYPNPSKGTLEMEVQEDCELKLFNSLGQFAFSRKLFKGKNYLEFYDLQNGIYIAKVIYAGTVESIKIIKE